MDKLPSDDDGWDRMLAQGGLPGPEADAMWDKIQAKVAPRPSWQQRLARMWFVLPLPFAAAAAVLVMTRVPDPGFVERGSDAALLEATCGTDANACAPGKPVFLRMTHPSGGTLYVALQDAHGGLSLVAGPVSVARGSTPLAVKLVPDAADVTSGITLHWWIKPSALEPAAITALLSSRAAPDGTLHLHVSAP